MSRFRARRTLIVPFAALALPAALAAQQDSTRRPVVVQEVTVTAERRPTRASDAATTARVVTGDELARRAAPDLTTVLRDVPGVQIEPMVGSGAGVALQGLGSDRVLVLLDGAPLAGRLSGELDLTRIAPAQLERIEVVEGPQSTLYGSAALGGVVNLLTRRDLARGAELSAQVGANGQRDLRGRLSGMLGSTSGSFDLGRRSLDLAPGRTAANPGAADRWDAMARAVAPLGAGSLDLRVLGIQEAQRYRTVPRSGAATTSFNDNWQLDALAAARLGADGATELRLHASSYDHRFIRSTTEERAGGSAEWDRQRTVDAEALRRGTFGAAEGAGAAHRWLAGAKVEREWLRSDRITGGKSAASTAAAYGSADWALRSWLRATTGVRLTAAEVWGTDVAPRLALVARGPGAVYLKTGVARGFRAPSFKELYTDFTNAGPPTYTVVGDTALRPEHSWNVGAELGRAANGTELYVRGFRNWLRDFIETSLVDQPAALYRYQNVDRARTAGIEVGGAVTRGGVTARASHAYLDTEDEATGTPLLGRAAHTTRGALTLRPGAASVGAEVVHTSSLPLTRSAAGATTYQGAYTRINLTAGVTVRDARLTVGVDNLADAEPVNASSWLGRRWYAGMTWGFGW